MKDTDRTAVQRSLFTDTGADIVYEQPLSERIRTFLRLEHLFEVIAANAPGESEWNSRVAIAAMIDITDLLSRSDLKAELMKELDRQAAVLAGLKRNPRVDLGRLEDALTSLDGVMVSLRAPDYQPGQTLRRDELVAAIRQRIAIPGGTCNFDLPAFHFWLTAPAPRRIARLRGWSADLEALREGIDLALKIIRSSAAPSHETASAGFFQQPLDTSVSCHLIRVGLLAASAFFPEVSAGKHRFTIRFLTQPETQGRPSQTGEDVPFVLERCVM